VLALIVAAVLMPDVVDRGNLFVGAEVVEPEVLRFLHHLPEDLA